MPINPTTLKALIDAQITNETVDFAITPTEVGSRMKDTIDYTTEQIDALQLVEGPQGPQGVQGPAGPIGPVGPAGLNWQGSWVSGTSYVEDDAVGYDGASWFCILPTSGTTTPDVDTTHWALLASQGAQGPQGVQGPTGAQGSVGPAGPQGPAGTGATQTLQQTIALGNTITNGTTTMTILADSIKTNDFLGGKIEIVSDSFSNPYLKFGLPASAGKTVILTSADTQTASRTIKLPDANGTVALTSDFTKTFGSLEIDNVSPYQILSYDLNSVITTGASDKVVLPSSAPIGKIVYVFAMSNPNNFTVRGNQAGSALISTGGIATQTSSVTILPNTSYQFISLGGGYWKSSQI